MSLNQRPYVTLNGGFWFRARRYHEGKGLGVRRTGKSWLYNSHVPNKEGWIFLGVSCLNYQMSPCLNVRSHDY